MKQYSLRERIKRVISATVHKGVQENSTEPVKKPAIHCAKICMLALFLPIGLGATFADKILPYRPSASSIALFLGGAWLMRSVQKDFHGYNTKQYNQAYLFGMFEISSENILCKIQQKIIGWKTLSCCKRSVAYVLTACICDYFTGSRHPYAAFWVSLFPTIAIFNRENTHTTVEKFKKILMYVPFLVATAYSLAYGLKLIS